MVNSLSIFLPNIIFELSINHTYQYLLQDNCSLSYGYSRNF